MPTDLSIELTATNVPGPVFGEIVKEVGNGRELWLTTNVVVGGADNIERSRVATAAELPIDAEGLGAAIEFATPAVAVSYTDEVVFRVRLDLTNPPLTVGLSETRIARPLRNQTADVLIPTEKLLAYSGGIDLGITITANADPADIGDEDLRVGDGRPEVLSLQEWLLIHGFLIEDPVPSTFDQVTEQGVLAFQLSAGIQPVGVVGPATREAINAFSDTAFDAGWHPDATRNVIRRHPDDPTQTYTKPKTFTMADRRGILHVTITRVLPGYQMADGGQRFGIFAPHFTIGRDGTGMPIGLWQHFPTTVASAALRSGVEYKTNQLGAIQIEVIGQPVSRPEQESLPGHVNNDVELAKELGTLMRWIETNVGVEKVHDYAFDGEKAWGTEGSVRLNKDEWLESRGWLGHQHVPNNKHWDPGYINIEFLMEP